MNKWTKLFQQAILGMIVENFLLEGDNKIKIEERIDGIWIYIWDTDIEPEVFTYWVKCNPNNIGIDYIVDYTTNLEKTLEPIFAFIKIFEDYSCL